MIANNTHPDGKTVVVIGNGMVGHRFCERLAAYDRDREYQVVTFCEEPRPAYDRVNLTKYFTHRDPAPLMLARRRTRRTRSRSSSATRRRPSTAGGGWSAQQAAGGHLQSRRARDRLGPVRPAGPGRGRGGGLRLPDGRRPGANYCLCPAGEAGGGRGRRPARAGGGEGGLRPRAGNARRRVRPRLVPHQVDDAGSQRRWPARSRALGSRST